MQSQYHAAVHEWSGAAVLPAMRRTEPRTRCCERSLDPLESSDARWDERLRRWIMAAASSRAMTGLEAAVVFLVLFTSTLNGWLAVILATGFLAALVVHQLRCRGARRHDRR
jgi:hypothetical protein